MGKKSKRKTNGHHHPKLSPEEALAAGQTVEVDTVVYQAFPWTEPEPEKRLNALALEGWRVTCQLGITQVGGSVLGGRPPQVVAVLLLERPMVARLTPKAQAEEGGQEPAPDPS